MNNFHCIVPKVLFGCGRLEELGELAAATGKKAFLAIDPFLEKSGLMDRVISLLTESGIEVTPFTEIEPDPDCSSADRAGKIARGENCDMIIAIGGGSAIDFGKGVAVVANNPGTAWEYTRRKDHEPKIAGPETLPIIAVPTTAGTGSEMTHFAVFSNAEIREKSTIVSERIFPRIAIVDPELTYSCPPRLTALTGSDVLAHAVEAYINIKASPWATLVSLEAIHKVGQFLRRAVSDGNDVVARQEMAWASTLAGTAIAHSNPTLPHALGQAAGGFLHAPHGASVAAVLPEVLRISGNSAPEVFNVVADALDPDQDSSAGDRRPDRCAALITDLFKDIGLNVRLGDFGMKEEDIDRVTKIAMTGYFTGISLHPVVADEKLINEIYRACL
jgi:alcohol dehydrogenase class IV